METVKKNAKDILLARTNNGFDFYHYVIPVLEELDDTRCKNILNPFYDDENAGLSIYKNTKTGRWMFKDYGDDAYSGDVFDFASLHYQLDVKKDFKTISEKISKDLKIEIPECLYGNSKKDIILDLPVPNEVYITELKSPEDTRIYSDFEPTHINDEDLWMYTSGRKVFYKDNDEGIAKVHEYFKDYGITKEILKEYNVHAINHYQNIGNGNVLKTRYAGDRLWVGYDNYKFTKIYTPDPKRFWYIGQRDPQHVFGLKQMIRRSRLNETKLDTIIITGGEKDVLTLTALGYDAICLNSETAKIPNILKSDLFYNINKIIILYDLDETGKVSAENLYNQLKGNFNVSICNLPDNLFECGGKDVSDYVKLELPIDDLHTCIENLSEEISNDVMDIEETENEQTDELPNKSENENGNNLSSEVDMFSTPFLPQSIYDSLPIFLKNICNLFDDARDKDLVLLSTLAVTSSFFPKIKGYYDGAKIGCNFYLFVSAGAGMGKGVMSWSRNLGHHIQNHLSNKYISDYKRYLADLKEYENNVANNVDADRPVKPTRPAMFIPANTSTSKMIELLGANKNFGVIFDNEADSLANALKNDWGNFTDVVRKAFHHETVSLARRGNDEFIEIQKPHLSIALSGTRNQINNLIESVENGFFSRFLFYDFVSQNVWKNQFTSNGNGLEIAFDEAAKYLETLWIKQELATETIIILQQHQIDSITNFFEEKLQVLCLEHGDDIAASLKRFCISFYRIAMLFSVYRNLEENEWLPDVINVSNEDFVLAMNIIECLLSHLEKVFIRLKSSSHLGKLNPQQRNLYEVLPTEFNTAEYEKIRETTGVKSAAGKKYLADFIKVGVLERIAHSQYRKCI